VSASTPDIRDHIPRLMEGDKQNIKVTTPFDLQVAKVVLG